MSQDAQSEFERIFGKTQKGSDAKPSEGGPAVGATQKLPSDSDLLGIRTDSDRFIVKNDLPESLPGGPTAASTTPQTKTKSEPDPGNKSSQDAMTIALNVNVFANIGDGKGGNKPGSVSNASADGATFAIPFSKDSAKAANASKPTAGAAAAKASVADEFTRILNPKNIPSGPSSNSEFTRVLHVEENVTVPKPNFPPAQDEAQPASTIAITSDPKLPAISPEPTVITQPGPSEFTKVVKGSELRTLQEKLAASAAGQVAPSPAPWPSPAPYPPSGSGTQPWQPAQQAPVPQYVPAQTQWPGSAPSPAIPPHPGTSQPSKLSQYMPLIIALNLLVLIAILLIVFFAIKK